MNEKQLSSRINKMHTPTNIDQEARVDPQGNIEKELESFKLNLTNLEEQIRFLEDNTTSIQKPPAEDQKISNKPCRVIPVNASRLAINLAECNIRFDELVQSLQETRESLDL